MDENMNDSRSSVFGRGNGKRKKLTPDQEFAELKVRSSDGDQDDMEYPHLRPVNAVPVEVGGATMVVVTDQDRISDKMIMVSPQTLFLISMFDGKTSVSEIQLAYNQAFGQLLFRDKIQDVIFELDAALLLNSKRFRQYMEFLKDEFLKSPLREVRFAGDSYPSSPEELVNLMDSFYQELPPDHTSLAPVGVVVPHIDYKRGGVTYASAYRQLGKSDADTFVIFATSHQEIMNLAALTRKNFSVPGGEIPVHREFVDRLIENCPLDLLEGEFRHRDEHTIEFQLNFLRHAFPEREISIIPVLVGPLDNVAVGTSPFSDVRVQAFVEAFSRTIEDTGITPAFIAGVDFSHVGPYFGDSRPPTPGEMETFSDMDRLSISFLEQGDAEGFFSDVIKDQPRRRVCGLSPLYLMMRVMSQCRGNLLDYRWHSDENRMNNVSFAAISFYPRESVE